MWPLDTTAPHSPSFNSDLYPSSILLSPSGLPGRITAEPLMYRAALQLARDASVEELLGNLQTYVRLILPKSVLKYEYVTH